MSRAWDTCEGRWVARPPEAIAALEDGRVRCARARASRAAEVTSGYPDHVLTHADALAPKRLLILGGWRDQQVTLEETVLPLVRGLRRGGAEHLTAATLDDDHGFEDTREALHGLVVDRLNGVCAAGH